ncbi:zinc transporter ZIP9 isoform X1 [Drosophila bipectinata]|uniref:zinc transporter ZIP9 isoform X1 n=2 Tax=Drosophila bipectinata TaxID=42026 RepID=UPI0007E69AC9|nr:zinc transporter ZIP9-B [Drosophila bipectinata]
MAETLILTLLVCVMLVGSYIAGSIPMLMKLSEEKLKYVTVLGAGLLVGTALAVIIPEGIRSLYEDNGRTQQLIHEPDHTQTIGLSLVLGFVFMMMVDVSQQRSNIGNDNKNSATLTLGLVVHAAADGIALGAAATTSHQDVELIVFLAIMLHKAPAAFGLVTFLLHEKVDRQRIRRHLALFSLSAPLLTLLTFFGIGQEQKETLNSVNATGIAMLFSAGTFLYVATVHVLPELTQGGIKQTGQHDYRLLEESRDVATNDVNVTHSLQSLNYSELVIMICGALLPLIITFGHKH